MIGHDIWTGRENFSPQIYNINHNPSELWTNHYIQVNEDSKDGSSKKTVRDPLSHRIIEKRRRDRMNNCLADLSKLIPTSYLKKGRGRIEKTEIIEMAIKHVKHLEAHSKVNCVDINRCDLRISEEEKKEEFRHGFREATSEVMRFLVEMHGLYPGDALCQGLVKHLRDHLAKIIPHNGTEVYSNNNGSHNNSTNLLSSPSSAHLSGTPQTPSAATNLSSTSPAPPLTPSGPISHHHHQHSTNSISNRFRSCEGQRERSASISSILSEGTTRSGSTPTPPKNSSTLVSESMEIESIEGRISKVERSSRLRDMLRCDSFDTHERLANGSTNDSDAVSMITASSAHNHHSTSNFTSNGNGKSHVDVDEVRNLGSTDGVVKKLDTNHITNSSNGLIRSTSVSPSSECYRFFKKGIKERFQSDMKQEFKNNPTFPCQSLSSDTTSSGSTQIDSPNCNRQGSPLQKSAVNGQNLSTSLSSVSPQQHSNELGIKPSLSPQPPLANHHAHPTSNCSLANSSSSSSSASSGSSSTYNYLNGSKVFKYKEKVITSVPAFALHPNGSFYIPLTINLSLIAHWFTSSTPETDDLFSVLHPVNIPVNFSYIQKCNTHHNHNNSNHGHHNHASHHHHQHNHQHQHHHHNQPSSPTESSFQTDNIHHSNTSSSRAQQTSGSQILLTAN